VGKRIITAKAMLELLEDGLELMLPLSKKEVYSRLAGKMPQILTKDYFPSVVMKVANRLERQGKVEKTETAEGLVIKMTEKGRKQLLNYKLNDFQPKEGKWDGKWRMVFFDVPERQNSKRDKLRRCLKQLGMKEMQESVWVSPYAIENEVKYIREVLEIPHAVKLAEMSYLENGEELKEVFNL